MKELIALAALLCIVAAAFLLDPFAIQLKRQAPAETQNQRRALAKLTRPVRVGVFGDIRPECRTGAYREAEIAAVLREIAKTAPDVIVATGDYVCAWPGESARALDQLLTVRRIAVEALGPDLFGRVRWAHGNHELGHANAVAAVLGDGPNWTLDLYGVRIVAAESDKTWQAGDKARVAWLHDQLLAPAGITVFVRHEPWGSHGTRNDTEMRGVVEGAGVDLQLFGHEHLYRRDGRRLTIGNGGAPGREGFLGAVILDVATDGTVTGYAVEAGTSMVKDRFQYKRTQL